MLYIKFKHNYMTGQELAVSEKLLLERDILRNVCEWLRGNGYFFWRMNNVPIFGQSNDGVKRFRAMPKYTPKGLPDICILREGMFVALEIKRVGFALRPEQVEMSEAIKKNGGEYYIVHNVDEVKEAMQD